MAEQVKIFDLSPDHCYDDRNAYVPVGETRTVIYPEPINVINFGGLIMTRATQRFSGAIRSILLHENAIICGTFINENPEPNIILYIGHTVTIKPDAVVFGFKIVPFIEDAGAIAANPNLPINVKNMLLKKS